jgi:SAM-dependent methyltransferase
MTWDRIGWHWNQLGRRNPFGAIITRDNDPNAGWDAEEFFETGRADAARFLESLDGLGRTVGRREALDFGCGVGRITRALAERFEKVIGVDVARSMIARAREINRDRPGCEFVVNRANHLHSFASDRFDVVYSRLVLQHMPPAMVRQYVPELIRVLAQGGVLMFQLPGEIPWVDAETLYVEAPVLGSALKRRLPKVLVRAYRRFKYHFLFGPRMEMFGMDRDEVSDTIRQGHGTILDIRPDQSHGPGVPGFEYWVTK